MTNPPAVPNEKTKATISISQPPISSVGSRLRPLDAVCVDTDAELGGFEVVTNQFMSIRATVKNVTFPMLLKVRPGSRSMIVFGQSALSTRDSYELPIYHRWTWVDEFPDVTCAVLSDPTLALDASLLGGWFQGTPDHYYAETGAELVRKLAEKLAICPDNIVFYGSSAGGFSSIVMAGEIGAQAVAEIPQIVMSNYHVGSAVRGLLQHSYGGISLSEAKRRFGARMDITTRFLENRRLPSIIYLQNLADSVHVERHMVPFLGAVARIWEENPELRSKRVILETYHARTAAGDGHVVAAKGITLRAIRRALQELVGIK